MKISLAKIAEAVGGSFRGNSEKIITGVASFNEASADHITFADNKKLLKRIDDTNAGAVIVQSGFEKSSKNILIVDNARVSFAKTMALFHTPSRPDYSNSIDGICSNAYIGNNFVCEEDVSIAPFVVIGNNVVLGKNVILHPNIVVGDDVVIGDDVLIYPNVTVLERCRIGNRVIIHAGSVIGSDGYGFAPDGDKYYKIPQTGIVQIDDDVEIGACNTIDRATLGKTWIRQGVKTDNLVHIAHNVTVGENTLLVAQVGIAGSSTIGKHATIAGQAAISGHITVGNNVTVGPTAGVAKSVPDNQIVSGAPAMPHRLWLRVQRIIPMLPELSKKLSEIEKRLNKM
ncbi:MAG: UDP-3-O-(3-hydroxymyristoyl)glucosamine N-acyltransferase [Desulfobacteraceae bacterium]|nr:UDP-3-O-(3-hydroxymyristoyl)glucosamine N-acyltransferase [Desulfobacteraceae bacterium]MBC2719444.1 UDP-3-O-(3-hydroxymyristoyl)glucosamine N-acyltransferase [Desulfobacteraceae bacterium]